MEFLVRSGRETRHYELGACNRERNRLYKNRKNCGHGFFRIGSSVADGTCLRALIDFITYYLL